MLSESASYLQDRARYAEAEPLSQRAVRIWEQSLEPEHPDVVSAFNNLTILYYQQGRYAEAQPLYQRALHIWEQRLRPDHPLTRQVRDHYAILQQTDRERSPECPSEDSGSSTGLVKRRSLGFPFHPERKEKRTSEAQ